MKAIAIWRSVVSFQYQDTAERVLQTGDNVLDPLKIGQCLRLFVLQCGDGEHGRSRRRITGAG
jgi:hypothetical protein